MITICTNNGTDYLSRLLTSLDKYGTDGHKVVIVDTGSTDEAFKGLLKLVEKKYQVDYIKGGRDTGAYFHAYKKYPSKAYMFMHDSMEATDKNWLKRFTDKKKDFVAFARFTVANNLCPIPERIASLAPYGVGKYGVMGPIFYATDKFMKQVEKAGYLAMIPKDRDETHATERLWGGLVEKLGYEVESVNGEFFQAEAEKYKGLKKFFPVRL